MLIKNRFQSRQFTISPVLLFFYILFAGLSFAAENDDISNLPYLKHLGSERIQTGSIRLKLSPPDAVIYFDGKLLNDLENDNIIKISRESERQMVFENLIPGTHTIKVVKKGYGYKVKNVLVEPGSEKTVNIRLFFRRWQFFLSELVILSIITSIGVGIYIIAAG